MLDDQFRAWLIEVNTCPSLAADSPMDKRVQNKWETWGVGGGGRDGGARGSRSSGDWEP